MNAESVCGYTGTLRASSQNIRGRPCATVIGAPSTGSAAAAVEVLPAEKFSPFIVPFRGAAPPPGAAAVTQANPFPVPPAYVQALDHKAGGY